MEPRPAPQRRPHSPGPFAAPPPVGAEAFPRGEVPRSRTSERSRGPRRRGQREGGGCGEGPARAAVRGITRGGTGLGLGPSGAALRGLRGARDGGRGVRGITVGPSRPLPPSPAGSRRSAASNGGARGSHMEPRGRSADNEALWGWGAAGRRSALLLTRLGVGELCCYGLNLIC